MLQKFILNRDDSLLLIIDIQEKLTKAMFNKDELLLNSKRLVEFADMFSLPVIFTEQNPKALGSTPEDIKSAVKKSDLVSKMDFSAVDTEFESLLKSHGMKNIIIAGMETHVCVYQTARDLLLKGYTVTVANDAVGSRTEKNYKNALDIMLNMGAVISNTETIIFDILHTSSDPNFKSAQALIK